MLVTIFGQEIQTNRNNKLIRNNKITVIYPYEKNKKKTKRNNKKKNKKKTNKQTNKRITIIL